MKMAANFIKLLSAVSSWLCTVEGREGDEEDLFILHEKLPAFARKVFVYFICAFYNAKNM